MQSCARALTYGIQPLDARAGIEVNLDASTHIVSSRTNRYIFLCDINADRETLLIDIREVMLGFFGIFMSNVKTNVVYTMYLHLLIYSSRHDITWSQREAFVIFLHEGLASRQSEYATITTHSLSDEVSRMSLAWMIERCRVELHKLHICNRSFSSIDHSHTVTSSDNGIGSSLIHSTASASTHHSNLREVCINLLRLRVQYIGTVALYIVRLSGHLYAKMVLGYHLNGKMVFLYINIGIASHCRHQSTLNLGTRIVGMMQNAKLRVSALTMKVEESILLLVEVNAPLHQFLNL